MLASLTPQQREELAGLMEQTLQQSGLADQMRRLGDSLYARRPDLAWNSAERVSGESPMGMSDSVSALQELADLNDLESSLRQDYPGARLSDVDEEAIRRALGRSAVDDLQSLKQIERELEQQGYLRRNRGKLELTAEGGPPPRRDRAAPGLQLAGEHPPGRPRPARRGRRRGADRLDPAVALRRRTADRRRPHA